MAARWMRWLTERRAKSHQPLGEAAIDHQRHGGYSDWACLTLQDEDPVPELSEAYSMLFEEVTRCRAGQAQTHGSTTPIESRPSGSDATAALPIAAWIQSLLVSPIFTEQKRQCGRAMPAAEKLTNFLVALDTRGGKMTAVALAKALQLPAFRLNSFFAVMQRVLNVDGYAVLLRDSASETVELNRELLAEQFALEVGR